MVDCASGAAAAAAGLPKAAAVGCLGLRRGLLKRPTWRRRLQQGHHGETGAVAEPVGVRQRAPSLLLQASWHAVAAAAATGRSKLLQLLARRHAGAGACTAAARRGRGAQARQGIAKVAAGGLQAAKSKLRAAKAAALAAHARLLELDVDPLACLGRTAAAAVPLPSYGGRSVAWTCATWEAAEGARPSSYSSSSALSGAATGVPSASLSSGASQGSHTVSECALAQAEQPLGVAAQQSGSAAEAEAASSSSSSAGFGDLAWEDSSRGGGNGSAGFWESASAGASWITCTAFNQELGGNSQWLGSSSSSEAGEEEESTALLQSRAGSTSSRGSCSSGGSGQQWPGMPVGRAGAAPADGGPAAAAAAQAEARPSGQASPSGLFVSVGLTFLARLAAAQAAA